MAINFEVGFGMWTCLAQGVGVEDPKLDRSSILLEGEVRDVEQKLGESVSMESGQRAGVDDREPLPST